MTQAQSATSGDTVKIHYRGFLDDGTEFESSMDGDPTEITIGSGTVIPDIESALVGMTPGQTKKITIQSEDAYGPYRPELIQDVDRTNIPSDINLDIGTVLLAASGDRELRVTVIDMNDQTITVDGNHPLSGKDLTFELELVEID